MSYMDWLLSNSEAENIGRWFLFTNYGLPDAYSDAYGGISLFDGVSTSSQLTDFGTLYRDKSQSTPLAAPSQLELQVPPVSDSNQTNVKLSWLDNTTTENGFYVERRTGTVGDWSPIATLDANATTYQDNGLDSTNMYYYRVQAFSDITP